MMVEISHLTQPFSDDETQAPEPPAEIWGDPYCPDPYFPDPYA